MLIAGDFLCQSIAFLDQSGAPSSGKKLCFVLFKSTKLNESVIECEQVRNASRSAILAIGQLSIAYMLKQQKQLIDTRRPLATQRIEFMLFC